MAPVSGTYIAIPLRAVKPTPQSIVQQGWKPKNLLRMLPSTPEAFGGKKRFAMAHRAQAFKIKSKNRAGVEIILMKKGGVYVPAWPLVPSVHIRETGFLSGPGLRTMTLMSQLIL